MFLPFFLLSLFPDQEKLTTSSEFPVPVLLVKSSQCFPHLKGWGRRSPGREAAEPPSSESPLSLMPSGPNQGRTESSAVWTQPLPSGSSGRMGTRDSGDTITTAVEQPEQL